MVNRVVRLTLAGLLFALILAGCQVAGAEPTKTQTSAATAGPVLSLAVDPADGSLLKVAGGLFRSTDQGKSWLPLPVPATLHPDKLHQVAMTAAAPSSLFAAGPGAGIVRSDNSGQTWRAISTGLPSQEVAAFAVHSFRPDTLYAWIAGQGIFRTEDGGGRWQKMDDGPAAPIVSLTHSTLEGSMNTGWLYAATPEGPYLSMDCF